MSHSSSKIRLLVFVLTLTPLLSSVSYAADKITLNCSGKVVAPGRFKAIPAPAESFVIDLDKGAVTTSSLGSFSIIKRTENRIDFKAESRQPGESTVGSVMLLTGVASVLAMRDNKMVSSYNFKCKRADPLF